MIFMLGIEVLFGFCAEVSEQNCRVDTKAVNQRYQLKAWGDELF